jgi:hypothetical protein
MNGSSIWEQLRVSTSEKDKYQLTAQLTQVVTQAKTLGDEVGIRVERLRICFYSFLWDMLAQLCITIMVSTFGFFLVGGRGNRIRPLQ